MIRSVLHLRLIAVLVLWTPIVLAIQTAVVHIDSGPVRGEEVTFEGTSYQAFKGIPYAAPPTGELRFKAPELPQKWTEVRDATSYGSVCPQPNFLNTSSEDCLTLNVFTQSLGQNDLRPVLVSIHGGGFYSGSGNDGLLGPEYLVKQNIIVVTFNYRLGNLGFLATNTPDATGNWGMKDQVAVLKWVNSNIQRFGGNPKRVTIYGESAGGISVHLHLCSPLSKGLFQQAILTSGTAFVITALRSPDQQERYSRNLARLLGASEDAVADPKKRIEFLRAADAKDVNRITNEVLDKEDYINPLFTPLTFTAVIEAPGTGGAFLTKDPRTQLLKGEFEKVPLMIGENDLEGSLLYSLGYGTTFTLETRRKIEENVCDILPKRLRAAVIAQNECPKVAQLVRDVYFDGSGFDSSYLNFVYLWGDVYIIKAVYRAQRLHTKYAGKSNPLYNYFFTFDGEWNMIKKTRNIMLPGAGHADELLYVYLGHNYHKPVLPDSSPEVITKNRMTSFITNFVKWGNPTPSVSDLVPVQWEPSRESDFSTMVIGNELQLEKTFLKTRMELWEQLEEKYGTNIASSAKTKHRLIHRFGGGGGWQNVLLLAYLVTVWNTVPV